MRPAQRISGFLLGWACLFLIGCSTLPAAFDRSHYAHLPASHTLGGIPHFPQLEDQCGPASLATMLGAQGITVTPQELRDKVYIPDKQGSLTTEMVARARRYGMLVYPLQPRLADVLTEISGGNPVLVLQNLGFRWLPRWHFSVVIGYDLQQNTILLRTGEHLSYAVDMQLFQKTWQRADHWAVVVSNPQALPKTAQESRYLKSASELELVGQTTAAFEAYQTALTHWPDSVLAHFGAGNAAYALQHYKQASDFFAAYIERQPTSSAAWNNLAYSLLKQECHNEAATAVTCALHLAPTNAELLQSQAEISAYPKPAGQHRSCSIPLCPAIN